ncbi:MAG TPA: LamG domain-containing protein [Kiritimatiellia bacterium]|nr:LamG domain-containing protein [Kiritimatiellia bacterium]
MKDGLRADLLATPGLLALWDFAEPSGADRCAAGPAAARLREAGGPVARGDGGPLSGFHAALREPGWFRIPRADLGPLNRGGAASAVTVLAWLRRRAKHGGECEFVAGCWDETRAQRQYGLFLNLWIHDSAQQVAAHVSHTGGPSPGHRWCMDAAIGATPVPRDAWHCVGLTYDGHAAAAWLDGRLDARPGRNPLPYPGALLDAGPDGADFTVGAVHRQGSMGNFLHADLGGLAVFDRALDAAELADIARAP